jgi:hypothetical protein
LEKLLAAKGAEAAYTALEDLGKIDSVLQAQGHPIAHELGAYALTAYGTIDTTLANCSYKVFGGCFHGALQSYFASLPQIDASVIQGLPCPSDTLFRQYTCLHGVGHGLMLATGNNLTQSLPLCDDLPTSFGQGSCWGGAFMENVVGYMENASGTAHHHGSIPQVYYANASDPQYPCDIVADKYKDSCWLIQTSLILYLHGGDFSYLAKVCPQTGAWNLTCYQSMGRDASDYALNDPPKVVSYCALALDAAGRAACIRGFAADIVLNFVSPERGIAACKQLPDVDKAPCYDRVGIETSMMRDHDGSAALCATAEPNYVQTCRHGAGLG